MNKEVGHPIGHNAIPEGGPERIGPIAAKKDTEEAGDSKENGKSIVFLPPPLLIRSVVILMQAPQKAVHNVFVKGPCSKFHKKEGADKE